MQSVSFKPQSNSNMTEKFLRFTLQVSRVPCLRPCSKTMTAMRSLTAQMMDLSQRSLQTRQSCRRRRRQPCQPSKPQRLLQLEEVQALHKDTTVLPADILAKCGEVTEEAGEARVPGPGANSATRGIDPGEEDRSAAVATGIGEVIAVAKKARSEDKMTIASAVLKRNGAAAAEHHCNGTRVVRRAQLRESNYKRGNIPI